MKPVNGLFTAGCILLGGGVLYKIAKSLFKKSPPKQEYKKVPSIKKSLPSKTDQVIQKNLQERQEKLKLIDASKLCDIFIALKIELVELYFKLLKKIENMEPQKKEAKLSKLPTKFNSIKEIVYNRYFATIMQVEEITKKYSDDQFVITHLKDFQLYEEEIKASKCPSLIKKTIEWDIFEKCYPLFLSLQWYYFYRLFRELIERKKSQGNSAEIRILKEEIFQILETISSKNIGSLAFKKFNIEVKNTQMESPELIINSCYYYFILCDAQSESSLIYYNKANKAIYTMIQQGQIFPEFDVSPLECDDETAKKCLTSILVKVNEYIATIASYMSQVSNKASNIK